MKKHIFILLFSFAVLNANSQSESRVSLMANTIQVGNFHAYSINPTFELAVSDHFNLRYQLGFGIRGNKKFYMHTPVTAPIGGILFVAGLGGGGGFISTLGILLLIVPEGVSYDISVSDNLELSPFIDLNSCEYYLTPEYNTLKWLLSGDAGLSCQLHLSDRFCFSAYTSLTMLESKGLGFSSGIGMGYKFDF